MGSGDGRACSIRIRGKVYHCPVEVTMDLIGGKWKAVVLWHLKGSTLRFSELKRLIPGITEKMLAQQLKELEQDGIVLRKVYPVVPPKVEYSITEYGKGLFPVIKALGAWGKAHAERFGKDYVPRAEAREL